LIYDFLVSSVTVPFVNPSPDSTSLDQFLILYEASPAYYLSFSSTLYHNFICLSSTPIPSAHHTTLANWLLGFLTKTLTSTELNHTCSWMELLCKNHLYKMEERTKVKEEGRLAQRLAASFLAVDQGK
jgi:hypothetical protein